jgi:uncharacterized protein
LAFIATSSFDISSVVLQTTQVTWIAREIGEFLRSLAQQRPAILVTGCRQSGKSRLLVETFKGHRHVSLDLPSIAELADDAGEEFLRQYPPPLLVDEVQYAPKLFRYIKAAIDEHRDQSGLFLLTGSQKFQLMNHISESLAGRVSVIDLYTLSASELEAYRGELASSDTLLEWMFRGGYPELHARDLDPTRFYADYVATYLERDVRSLAGVRNLRDFNRFLRLCATRTGQLLSMNGLATDVGVSVNTVQSWIGVLEASGIITLLSPYYRNLGKRLVKTPKLYFTDTGLACFLTGISNSRALQQSSQLGAYFETYVLGQLLRWHANRGRPLEIYFYRDHYGHEVDFVIPEGDRLRLFECKWSPAAMRRPAGFIELEKLLGQDGIVSAAIVTSERGLQTGPEGCLIDDVVSFHSLTR